VTFKVSYDDFALDIVKGCHIAFSDVSEFFQSFSGRAKGALTEDEFTRAILSLHLDKASYND
jgi:hypothetical protein